MGDRAERAERADGARKPTSTRVIALVSLWTVVMVAMGFASGCYGHNCDGDIVVYGRAPGEGHLLNADTWESTPVETRWLDFPRARFWIFEMKDLGDRYPEIITPYVSAQRDPTHEEGGNFTNAAGNLAEISGIDKGRVTIHNGTCADYSLRLVVQAAPRPPATPSASIPTGTLDAGGDSEAGP